MSDLSLAIPVLAGVSFGGFMWALLSVFFSEESRVRRRLKVLSEAEYAQATAVEPLAAPFAERVVGRAGRGAVHLITSLMPAAYAERLRVRIRLSGPRRVLVPELFVGMKVGLGFLGLAIGVLAWVMTTNSTLVKFLTLVLAICIGFFAPDAWLSGRVAARQTAIRHALPDMLDMLNVSVEAGLGFDASLSKVVSSTRNPLSQEFSIMLQEVGAGMPRREALQRLAERTGVPELTSFIMAIIQADVFGVSVANVLRAQAREMRVKRRQRAEELAQMAPAKMVFPIIICILPATVIVVAGPAVISIARAFGAGI